MRCRIVAGSANNQLAEPADAQRLLEREIVYVPDYIINAGGALSFALMDRGYADETALFNEMASIGETVREILQEAAERGRLARRRRRAPRPGDARAAPAHSLRPAAGSGNPRSRRLVDDLKQPHVVHPPLAILLEPVDLEAISLAPGKSLALVMKCAVTWLVARPCSASTDSSFSGNCMRMVWALERY